MNYKRFVFMKSLGLFMFFVIALPKIVLSQSATNPQSETSFPIPESIPRLHSYDTSDEKGDRQPNGRLEIAELREMPASDLEMYLRYLKPDDQKRAMTAISQSFDVDEIVTLIEGIRFQNIIKKNNQERTFMEILDSVDHTKSQEVLLEVGQRNLEEGVVIETPVLNFSNTDFPESDPFGLNVTPDFLETGAIPILETIDVKHTDKKPDGYPEDRWKFLKLSTPKTLESMNYFATPRFGDISFFRGLSTGQSIIGDPNIYYSNSIESIAKIFFGKEISELNGDLIVLSELYFDSNTVYENRIEYLNWTQFKQLPHQDAIPFPDERDPDIIDHVDIEFLKNLRKRKQAIGEKRGAKIEIKNSTFKLLEAEYKNVALENGVLSVSVAHNLSRLFFAKHITLFGFEFGSVYLAIDIGFKKEGDVEENRDWRAVLLNFSMTKPYRDTSSK